MMGKLLFSVTIKDLEIQTFRSRGPGGQNANKRDTGVRLVHEPSGAIGIASDTRYQHQNKVLAFDRLCKSDKFQSWIKVESARRLGLLDKAEKSAEKAMHPDNLKIEVLNNDKWEEADGL